MVREFDASMSDVECDALSGHLNLGIASAGTASIDVIQREIVTWVSRLIYDVLRPRIVVGLGLTGLLTKPASSVANWWNEGGLVVDWRHMRTLSSGMGGRTFAFRHSRGQRADGGIAHVILWHNHPSRAPFGGAPGRGSYWDACVDAGVEVLRGEGAFAD